MHDEHDRAHRDLARRAERLATAVREFETLSLAVAHDFRTPMEAIASNIRAISLRNRDLDERARHDLAAVQEAVRHMHALIGNLTALCRAASQPMDLQEVDMESMVRHAWAATPRNGGVDIIVGKLPKARGSPAMLRLVWANLLANAVARIGDEAGPRIEIGGGGAGGFSVYSVRDNGPDLALHFTGKLYHAFEQIQQQSPYPGTGVALAIVQRIVTRHRGNVWVERAPDRGAVFQFSIGEVVDL